MRVVAYCRVSTNKDEQLDSLEAQQRFFAEYAERNRHRLVRIYADEGKSGTKMKNRTQLLRLLADAGRGEFDMVLIKDVSRLARNTLDFLTSIRKLKALGIKVVFVNYDQTSSESSEFMLTLLSAMAQEESANTSKRIKFGKKINAAHGRVPNLVYGYDKIPGEYFTLHINEEEARVVRRIFDWYANQNLGAGRIAMELNRLGVKTKRGSCWSQNTVSRMLCNQLYIGRVINGKQEVEDFLTSRRGDKPPEEWAVVERPELKLVDEALFYKAQEVLRKNRETFRATGQKRGGRHAFSKLIRCTCCGAAFRRVERGKKGGAYWVCTGRNANGADYCPNRTKIGEDELLGAVRAYFCALLQDKPGALSKILAECDRRRRDGNERLLDEKELSAALAKARRSKRRYLEMYENEVIDMATLKEKAGELNETIRRLGEELRRAGGGQAGPPASQARDKYHSLEDVFCAENLGNPLLCQLIDRIEADEYGRVDVYLRPIPETGQKKNVPICDNRT
jgi:site-specific DNA recombinase